MLQFLFWPRQSTEFDLLFTGPGQQLQVIICLLFQRMWQSVWLTSSAWKGFAWLCLFLALTKSAERCFKTMENVQAHCRCPRTSMITSDKHLWNCSYWYSFWNAAERVNLLYNLKRSCSSKPGNGTAFPLQMRKTSSS